MTARAGPRLGTLLSDLGVAHPNDLRPVPRPSPPLAAHPTDPTAVTRVVVNLNAPGLDGLEEAGLRGATGSGTVVTGRIRLDQVPDLLAHPRVDRVELPERLQEDIHSSVPATHADIVRTGVLNLSGAGVLLGIIDSGIDVFHGAFRHDDDTTRIVALRDFTSPHRLVVSGAPTGGSFMLGWVPPKGKPGAGTLEQSSAIPFNATAAQVQTALETIPAIKDGDLEVDGGPLPSGITVQFTGRYLRKDVNDLVVYSQALTPGTAHIDVVSGHTYSEEDIDDALENSPDSFGHWDDGGHGTHVAGIAAGDGSQAGNCHLADYYVGVAPDADLIVAKTRGDDQMIEALEWMFDEAQTRGQALAVNISQFGLSGARDGSTPLERKIDELLEATPAGRAIVKSAGNTGALHDWNQETRPQVYRYGSSIHSFKSVPANDERTMTAVVIAKDRLANQLDFWYSGAGRLTLTVKAPRDPDTTPPCAPDDPFQTEALHGHTVRVTSQTNASTTGRHRIFVEIVPPSGRAIRTGEWVFTLTETAGTPTDVHCWILAQRPDQHPRFIANDDQQLSTLTTPGTAHRIITVANYDHREDEIAESSSRGPTTDERTGFATKPDIAAPGTGIVAARSGAVDDGICCQCCRQDVYATKSGTSMAAPHITGIIALIFERNESLTWEQVRAHLRTHAEPPDPITGPTLPNHTWGAGIVNAETAAASVPALVHAGASPTVRRVRPADLPVPAVVPAVAAQIAPGAPAALRFDELRAAVLATPAGRLAAALVSTHLSEVRRLVDHERRVTVAWHRMGGPALVELVLTTPEGVPIRIPEQVAGRDLRDGLGRFLDALVDAGSLPLRQDVSRHRELLLTLPGLDVTALEHVDVAG